MTHTPISCTCPGEQQQGLPIGTLVWNATRGLGTVMHHEPQWSHGAFPVRWNYWLDCPGIWETCDRSTVTAVTRLSGAQPRRNAVPLTTALTVVAAVS